MLVDRLEEIMHSGWLIRRPESAFDHEKKHWVEKVLPEHQRKAFRGIICDGPKELDCVLTKYDLNDKNPCWYVDPTPQVKRTAGEMAMAFAPLGQISTDLLVIDPFFGEKPQDFSSIPAIIAASHRGQTPLQRIEIHTVGHRKSGVVSTRNSVRHALSVEFRNQLPKDSPPIRVSIWERLETGDVFHDRYLLTNLGGVGITVGLDVGQGGVRANQETTMFRLGPELYQRRKSQFDRMSACHQEEYRWIEDIMVQPR